MFQDIFTKDMTLDEDEKEAAFALLCKYLVQNIDTINDGNLKEYVGYWFANMKNDGVSDRHLKEFQKELRRYIPDAVH